MYPRMGPFCMVSVALPVLENEALMLQPGEAITRPLQALLRSGAAS